MATDLVSLDRLVAGVKAHPQISRARMILFHNGIVKESDRSGARSVRGLKVAVDHAEIERIRPWARSQPGIVTAEIEVFEGEFCVGDDLLYVIMAGDVRENVFATMREMVERIKGTSVHKTELYAD